MRPPQKRQGLQWALWILATCALVAVLVSGYLVVTASATAQTQQRAGHPRSLSPTATPTTPPTAPPLLTPHVGLPIRLIIPAIEVNATIEPLGLTATGDLQVPQTRPFDDVGWYRLGKRPGEHGNAVIDGHLDRQDGSPAVFWNLRQLQPGEHVLVIDAVGHTFSFHIDQIVRYPPDQAPLTQIFGPATGVHLNLITCAGVWIPAQHQTTLRLVVYTTLDQPSPDI